MKKAPIFVAFHEDTARIYRDERSIPAGIKYIKNPDLTKARGVQMHEWTPELFGRAVFTPHFRRTAALTLLCLILLGAAFTLGMVM